MSGRRSGAAAGYESLREGGRFRRRRILHRNLRRGERVSERPTAGRSRALGATLLLWLAGAALLADSCAYYNTYYLARKYYDRATGGLPYPVEKPDPTASQNFTRAIDYSKKVIGNYPKSKWVDDAYLMWARALLGQDDPRQTVNMLQDFS